jgi:hypothetical protein
VILAKVRKIADCTRVARKVTRQKKKEGASLSPKMRHKVDKYVEDQNVGNLVRKVAQIAGDGLGRLMVKRIAIVLLDHRSLSINGENF